VSETKCLESVRILSPMFQLSSDDKTRTDSKHFLSLRFMKFWNDVAVYAVTTLLE